MKVAVVTVPPCKTACPGSLVPVDFGPEKEIFMLSSECLFSELAVSCLPRLLLVAEDFSFDLPESGV